MPENMRGPEFRNSEEALKGDAWKVLLRDTEEDGIVSALLRARGIFSDDIIRERLEYVRDEVTRDIARFSSAELNTFCGATEFREAVYNNKISDFGRKGRWPFVDINKTGARRTDVSAAPRHLKAMGRVSMESPHFMARLEAADELSEMIQAIEDEQHRQRLETILKGAASGWTNNEIADELGRIEGKRVCESRITQIYAHLREKYLEKKFPNMPATLDGLRSLIEPKKREVAEDRARKKQEYSALLSEELERLAGEEQTAQTEQEILVIEYLLGRRSRESLATAQLSANRQIRMVKERIASRLSIPLQYLHQGVVSRQR